MTGIRTLVGDFAVLCLFVCLFSFVVVGVLYLFLPPPPTSEIINKIPLAVFLSVLFHVVQHQRYRDVREFAVFFLMGFVISTGSTHRKGKEIKHTRDSEGRGDKGIDFASTNPFFPL